MKRLLLALVLAVPLAFSASVASASGSSTTKLSKKESACAIAKKQGKPCKITFGEGDDIEGGTVSPDGDDVISRMQALFGGLIELRVDFRDKIIAAADDF